MTDDTRRPCTQTLGKYAETLTVLNTLRVITGDRDDRLGRALALVAADTEAYIGDAYGSFADDDLDLDHLQIETARERVADDPSPDADDADDLGTLFGGGSDDA